MSSGMEDVFGSNPRRPEHPDFWRLSEVMLGMDAGFDETADEPTKARLFEKRFEGVVDRASVVYIAEQRVLRVAGRPRNPSQVVQQALLAGLWVDAFLAGVKFAGAEKQRLQELVTRWEAASEECAARAGDEPASTSEVEDDAMATIYGECAAALKAALAG